MATDYTKPVELSGLFKRGSSWPIGFTRKDESGAVVDMTGLTTRAMFRTVSVAGTVKFTLDDAAGVTIADPTTGFIALEITRSQSALFTAGDKVYFDIEQTNSLIPDYEWHSLTYWFKVVEQVTRDD